MSKKRKQPKPPKSATPQRDETKEEPQGASLAASPPPEETKEAVAVAINEEAMPEKKDAVQASTPDASDEALLEEMLATQEAQAPKARRVLPVLDSDAMGETSGDEQHGHEPENIPPEALSSSPQDFANLIAQQREMLAKYEREYHRLRGSSAESKIPAALKCSDLGECTRRVRKLGDNVPPVDSFEIAAPELLKGRGRAVKVIFKSGIAQVPQCVAEWLGNNIGHRFKILD